MPKTIHATASGYANSGITITYTRSARRIDVSGWYDSSVRIEGNTYTLGDFLCVLGITEADVRRVLRRQERP